MLESTGFDNSTLVIQERPTDENLTCREMLSYIAQMAGGYVWEDDNGKISIKWYEEVDYGTESCLDGGDYADYDSGDTADGGDYTDYDSGDTADGGNYSDLTVRTVITKIGSQNISTEDVEITGIRVKMFNSSDDEEGILVGNTDYALEVSENPLINTTSIAE